MVEIIWSLWYLCATKSRDIICMDSIKLHPAVKVCSISWSECKLCWLAKCWVVGISSRFYMCRSVTHQYLYIQSPRGVGITAWSTRMGRRGAFNSYIRIHIVCVRAYVGARARVCTCQCGPSWYVVEWAYVGSAASSHWMYGSSTGVDWGCSQNLE